MRFFYSEVLDNSFQDFLERHSFKVYGNAADGYHILRSNGEPVTQRLWDEAISDLERLFKDIKNAPWTFSDTFRVAHERALYRSNKSRTGDVISVTNTNAISQGEPILEIKAHPIPARRNARAVSSTALKRVIPVANLYGISYEPKRAISIKTTCSALCPQTFKLPVSSRRWTAEDILATIKGEILNGYTSSS